MSVAALELTALERDIANSTHDDLKDFVHMIVNRFAFSSGIPRDELLSVANYYYMKAVSKYKKGCGAKLITWVGFVVTKQLTTYLQKTYRFKNTHFLCEINEEILPGGTSPTTFVMEIKEHVGDDAKLLIDMILDGPEDLKTLLEWRSKKRKSVTPLLAQRVLKEHLSDLGWSRDRIAIAFEDIVWILSKTK